MIHKLRRDQTTSFEVLFENTSGQYLIPVAWVIPNCAINNCVNCNQIHTRQFHLYKGVGCPTRMVKACNHTSDSLICQRQVIMAIAVSEVQKFATALCVFFTKMWKVVPRDNRLQVQFQFMLWVGVSPKLMTYTWAAKIPSQQLNLK